MNASRKTKGLWSIVMVELTNICNFSCPFCPTDSMARKKANMPRDLWQKVLRELGEKEMTPTVFFHLMGEPLVHKDIFDAICFANDYGLSVSLYTNGALLDSDRSEMLLDALRIGRVVLSLQLTTPDTFYNRSRRVYSWKTYIERLKNFTRKAMSRERPVSVQVHCLADVRGKGWNLVKILQEQRRIQAVYDEWQKALGNGKRHKINIFNPATSYPLDNNASFFVKHQGTWDNKHIPPNMDVLIRDHGHCHLMTDTFAILADGTCTVCCCDYEAELDLGNAHENTLEDIYNGKKATAIREAEEKGKMIEERCRICRGTLVYRKNRKPVPSRNLFTEFYFFRDHLRRYGLKSSVRKIRENIHRRLDTYF